MLNLSSTSDIVRIVTSAAVTTITVHASWMDYASGTTTPGRTNTNITTATTTTVVASPGASTTRNVKGLYITNNNASSQTQVTVQHYDGTTSTDLCGVTLLAGENLVFDAEGEWHHHDAQGADYAYTLTTNQAKLGITGTLAETMPRQLVAETNTTVAASGTLNMQLIYLYAGQLVSNISISSATTAAGTPTNYRFGLFDSSRNLLAESANQTTSAWAANTLKTLAMTTPYRVPTSGVYYIGYYMTATTVPTLKGHTAKTGAQLAGAAPILQGSSSTGLTTALPNPAAAITVSTASFWAAVS